MAQVVLDQVTKVYPGNVKAVDAISLHIPDTKFIVFVGPSGCGKSTTLRMIAGLEEISGGTIQIGDRVVNEIAPKDRDIAMVFQNYALYPHMTVYKNMAFGLKLRGMPKREIDERVREAAQILGITHLLERRPKALSGGQRQRVAVGRAIVRHPAVFLFDEPLSNLDAKLRVETRAELKRLHQRLQTTTIYVTHDQEEAMTLGDKVVVMSDGLIQQADTPLEVYQRPANRFVAGFLGTPPMNFVDGALQQKDGRLTFVGGGFEVPLTPEQVANLTDGGAAQPRDVVLGIRPEGLPLHPVEQADGATRTIPVTIDVAETLGSQMDLYVTTPGGARLVARVEARPMTQGASATLHVDAEKVHVFEPGTYGVNLTLSEDTRRSRRAEEEAAVAV